MRLRDRIRVRVRWDPMPEFVICLDCQGRCYLRSVVDGSGLRYKTPRGPNDRHKGLFPCPTCKAKGVIATAGTDNAILERMGYKNRRRYARRSRT